MTHTSDYPEILQVLQSQSLSVHIKCRLATLEPKPNVSAEDVLQYVLLSLIQAKQSGKEVRNSIAWGKCVAERYINKQYKLRRRNIILESNTLEFLDNIYRQETPSLDACEIEYLHSQIELLKDCDRQIIQLRFFDGLTWNQIADLLSKQSDKPVNEQNARQKGKRALDKLRNLYISHLQ
jgi:RNA polymerase sigma factor (sigma-70 family)